MTENESKPLIECPSVSPCTFLDFPLVSDLDNFQADVAILGIPFGMRYAPDSMANDQSRAPDTIRQFTKKYRIYYSVNHFDWDLRGPLLDGCGVKVVDCGNGSRAFHNRSTTENTEDQSLNRLMRSLSTLVLKLISRPVAMPDSFM